MKITVKGCILKNLKSDVLVIPVFEDHTNEEELFKEIDNILNRLLSQKISGNKDIGKELKFTLFSVNSRLEIKNILLAGFGKINELDEEKIRKLGGKIGSYAKSNNMKEISFLNFGYSLKNIHIKEATNALLEGVLLGSYIYEEFKSKKEKNEIELFHIIPQIDSDIRIIEGIIKETEIICINVNLVRDLVNKPSNIMPPEEYSNMIKKIFTKTKVRVNILNERQIKKEKMNCILAVGKGSAEKPRVVVLNYTPLKPTATYCIVGKGVTFDSGGINLKPTQNLLPMKEDMAGSASVVGIIKAACELKLPVKLIGILPLVENMPSGSALKPGDVITSSNGKTIEVENTDAEGRLILADALHYATKSKPNAIIDIATLTGASVIALGSRCTSLMGNSQEIIDKIMEAGKQTHELAWQLPLLKEYEDDIKSDIADIKNLGQPNSEAGVIIGGIFLKEFIGDNKWAHLDIGATVWANKEREYTPKGATGVPVRMIMKFLMSH